MTSVELADDHGATPVWEVETVTGDGTEHELLVDPHTGALRTVSPRAANDDHDDHDGGDD